MEQVEKKRAFAVIWRDIDWIPALDARLIVTLGPHTGLGLVTLYHDDWTLAFGLPKDDQDVYLPSGRPVDGCHEHCKAGIGTHCYTGWIWGSATEAYDMCLDYFGLGPVLLACWQGGSEPPKPVRAVGWACRKSNDLLDDGLRWFEQHLPKEGAVGRVFKAVDSYLSVTVTRHLAQQAWFLDPNKCGHPGCLPRQPCKFPEERAS